MENPNEVAPIPQPRQQYKKWYQHKGFITILVLAVIAAVAVWVYFILNPTQTYVSSMPCNGTYCPFVRQTNKPASQQPTSTPDSSDISSWKTYTNTEYGFSFQYPNTWTDTGRSVDIEEYFTKSPEIEVLDINAVNATGTLTEFADNDIAQNNCPGDQIIQTTNTGVLYVENCSATSESYLYIFRNSQNQAIQLSYQDDFDENASVATKIATLKQIISSLKLSSVTPQVVGPPTIKEILVKAGVDVSPQQDSTFTFLVAQGHYLLWTYENDTVIYDGKIVYVGTTTPQNFGTVDSVGLSANGLHYAYAVKTNQINPGWDSAYATHDDDLYLDGQKIISNQNIESIAISDDGQHYMFASTIDTSGSTTSTTTTIYKDGQSVYQAQGIDGINLSSDGSSYSTTIYTTGDTEQLVVNGQLVPNGLNGFSEGAASNLVFSPNNQHYAYSTPTAIFVDGQAKYQLKDGNLGGCLQVTDEGHYALCDYARSGFVIDGKLYPNPNVGGGGVSININSDATHYLIFDSQKWSLDGKTVTFKTIDPQWQEDAVDVVGNTFYVYSLVQ